MPTDQEIQAFFAARTQRVAELLARYRAGWPWSFGGCGVGCLVPIGLLLLFLETGHAWAEHPHYTKAVVGAWVVAIACAVIGVALYKRGQLLFEPIDAAADADLMAPFAALLVPGATFERPGFDACTEWRASLIFPREAHLYMNAVARVSGRLAGLPAVVDELNIRNQHRENSSEFTGWVVRVELPFTVGGHLRAIVPMLGYGSLMWNEGFEPHEGAEARLGKPYQVDVAAPGVTPEGADQPTPPGVPADTLLTDALFDLLRSDGKLQLALSGRTLWVVVPRIRVFDPRSCLASFDAKTGRKAADRIAAVEAIAREVVRAGTGA